MLKYFIPLAAFAVLVALLAFGLGNNPREVPSPFIGKPAPAFNASRLYQNTRLSNTDLKGEVWLLNIWASWCSGCQTEHPLLTQLIQSQKLTAVGLNYKDENHDAKRWLTAFGNPFQAIITDQDGKIGLEYGVYGVPETFIIDRHGIVRHKQVGELTPEAVRDTIIPLIAELRQEHVQ